MVKIRKNIVPTSVYNSMTYPNTNTKEYIVIHETANTNKGANADAHGRLQANGNSRNASWHYTVDDKEAVQSFNDDAQCWHAGSAKYNRNSIGIEICVNSDGNYKKAVDNAVELVKQLIDKYNIPAKNVIQHHTASKKDCPHFMRKGNKGVTWSDFVNKIGGKASSTKKSKPSKPKTKAKTTKKTTGKVATIQDWVNKTYGYRIAVDNIVGKDTKKHLLKAYQTELNKQFSAGLAVDGLWGPKTATASVTVRKGAKGNLTRILQSMLVVHGLNIAVDGIFGNDTEKAVKSFQKKAKISVDGVPGKATFAKLFA